MVTFSCKKVPSRERNRNVVTFVQNGGGSSTIDQRFTQWVNGTVGIIEDKGNGRVVVRVASHRYRLPNAMMSWFTVCLTNACCDVLVTMPSRVHNIFVMDQIGFLRKRS